MMCGLPFAQRAARPRSSPRRCPRRARYGGTAGLLHRHRRRADAPHQSIEDTFGGASATRSRIRCRAASRARITSRPARGAARLYGEAVGELITRARRDRGDRRRPHRRRPAGRLLPRPAEAARPELAAQVRTIATTPLPDSAARGHCPLTPRSAHAPARRAAGAQRRTGAAAAMERLLLAGFAVPEPATTGVLATIRRL